LNGTNESVTVGNLARSGDERHDLCAANLTPVVWANLEIVRRGLVLYTFGMRVAFQGIRFGRLSPAACPRDHVAAI